jgi:hypothetical protein
MHKVAELAQENWEAYIGNDIVELPHGHLLPYPLDVRPLALSVIDRVSFVPQWGTCCGDLAICHVCTDCLQPKLSLTVEGGA